MPTWSSSFTGSGFKKGLLLGIKVSQGPSEQMPRRSFKFFTLQKKLHKSKDFLKKINATKNKEKLKSVLFEASPQDLLTLESLIIASFDEQEIPFSDSDYRKLERSGLLEFIKKKFKPKIEHSFPQTKKLLLKIAPVLKIFTQNSVASK